jgi:hypothetical protein
VYHDFQHSCIDVEICDSTRTGTWCIANDSDCMAAKLSAALGPEAAACAHLGTGWTEKQDDSQIDEANKTKHYLRNTDHFKVITPRLNLNERLRDSPVPWHYRAECQLIGFKAAMALRSRQHVEDSSAVRRAQAKLPVRHGASSEVS